MQMQKALRDALERLVAADDALSALPGDGIGEDSDLVKDSIVEWDKAASAAAREARIAFAVSRRKRT